MSIAMGTRLHINLYIYIYKTRSVPFLVLLSQNAQSDEKVILSRCTKMIFNVTFLDTWYHTYGGMKSVYEGVCRLQSLCYS